MMTTFWIALAALALWFAATAPASSPPWWRQWIIEVLRIIFACATLVTLWAVMNRVLV
jgi:hypothetical protein